MLICHVQVESGENRRSGSFSDCLLIRVASQLQSLALCVMQGLWPLLPSSTLLEQSGGSGLGERLSRRSSLMRRRWGLMRMALLQVFVACLVLAA